MSGRIVEEVVTVEMPDGRVIKGCFGPDDPRVMTIEDPVPGQEVFQFHFGGFTFLHNTEVGLKIASVAFDSRYVEV